MPHLALVALLLCGSSLVCASNILLCFLALVPCFPAFWRSSVVCVCFFHSFCACCRRRRCPDGRRRGREQGVQGEDGHQGLPQLPGMLVLLHVVAVHTSFYVGLSLQLLFKGACCLSAVDHPQDRSHVPCYGRSRHTRTPSLPCSPHCTKRYCTFFCRSC